MWAVRLFIVFTCVSIHCSVCRMPANLCFILTALLFCFFAFGFPAVLVHVWMRSSSAWCTLQSQNQHKDLVPESPKHSTTSLFYCFFHLSSFVPWKQPWPKDSWDVAPLFLAVDNGHCEVVRLLLDARARCTAEPLRAAAENGDAKVVGMMLEAGGAESPISSMGPLLPGVIKHVYLGNPL